MPVSEPKLLGAGEWGYFRDDYLNLDQCRVILPYTRFEPKVREAIDATGWNYEPFDVSASDDAYWKLLRVLWGDGKTFIIIEHDIVIRPGTLRQLAGCVSHWCCFPYPLCSMLTPTILGCTKFDSVLIAEQPDLIERISGLEDELHPPKHWCRLDQHIQRDLIRHQYAVCQHLPPVEHLRDQPEGSYVHPGHGCLG